MEDSEIIGLFFSRSEEAVARTAEKYGTYCRSIARNILASREDTEECLNDTWLAAWDSIPPQRPDRLSVYLGRITRNLAIGIWRKNNARCRGGGETALALEELGEIAGKDSAQEALQTKELSRAISAFLKTQPEQRRKVFVRRYFYLEDMDAIAHRYGLRPTNVRMMLSRTRQKLRQYLIKEGYDL